MYEIAYQRSKSLFGQFERKPGDHLTTHYCPGCGHGNLQNYIAEALDEIKAQDRTVFINSVGCSVFAYYYFDVGNIQVPHGRAPAVATAVKRALPDSLVVAYQGDGDLAAIGGNEILHAANRGENITVIFVNNATYGMTGGQMAPTTLVGQKTTTSPLGRTVADQGFPLRVSELLATLEGPTYIERVGLYDNKSRMKARKAVKKALRNQFEGRGFSLVEVLSPCPTGWGMTPSQACDWVREDLARYFPLGVLKDLSTEREGWTRRRRDVLAELIPAILGIGEDHPGNFGTDAGNQAQTVNARIKIAGFGGQGILFLGKVLADAGMRQGYHVSWIPSYGPEMRGGTANCHVNISTDSVGSPLISDPSVLVALNRPSLEKFQREVVTDGLIVFDSSLIDAMPIRDDVRTLAIPATAIADRLGNPKVANMVALGALVKMTGLLDADKLAELVASHAPLTLRTLNTKAMECGREFAGTLVNEECLWAV